MKPVSRRIFMLIAAVAVSGLAARAAEEQAPAAQLLNVKGTVEVRSGSGAPAAARLLMPLHAGDVVRVREGSAAEVLIRASGARYALAAGSAAQVTARGLRRRSGAAPRPLRRLAIPAGPARLVSPGRLGLNTRDPRVEKGAPYGAVRDFPVLLKWASGSDKELAVSIQDEARKPLHSAAVPGSVREFRVPDGLAERGKFYVWTLTPAGETKAAVIGFFRILTPQEKTALEFLERQAGEERAASPDNPSPVLLLAQTYERFGMYSDAMTAYQSAAQMRPNDQGLQDAMKRLSFGS